MELDPRTPILVGGGQITQRTAREGKIDASLDQISLMAAASLRAIDDANGIEIVKEIDTVSVVRFIADSGIGIEAEGFSPFANPPLSLAKKLGLNAQRHQYSSTGGNMPQWLINQTAEEISRGESQVALLVGAECIASMVAANKNDLDLGWIEKYQDIKSAPTPIGEERLGYTSYESRHGLALPATTYPLFENALRHAKGRSPKEHLEWLGGFFEPFTKIASENPYAWFQTLRSGQEISTPTKSNRFIAYPYTKYMNSVLEVDMAAAVLMMSVGKARELQIPQSQWVFLHGCADANDKWFVTERINFHSSPAIREMSKVAFGMAKLSIDEIAFIDLYSCFPSAVQMACFELGISADDPRGLTVTGGLPYFGGAGNNYVMHSVVSMMHKLRKHPEKFGLCTGNGWYITKHSMGIYSTKPVLGRWEREMPSTYQKKLDEMVPTSVCEEPKGDARVETYTVTVSRDNERCGIIVGRLNTGERFLAHTPKDEPTLDFMMREEVIGKKGIVTPGHTNLFYFSERL